LQLALNAVADGWPDALKQEIIQLDLAQARLSIPYTIVERGLKRGRLSFNWKQLKSWLTPSAASGVSAHDNAELELALRVVAPLFIAQQKEKARETTKVAVDKDIPNLFAGLPQPDTAGVAVDHSVSRPLDTNYYVWDDRDDMVAADPGAAVISRAATAGTEFVTRYATPNEVVSRAASLDGVVGAVIALPDGLMVANQLPPGLNGDTLAAFLPQLFSKVTQCTQELRMGELNNLNFTVGNVPWKIFRVNALYFAAFGNKGEPLPTARLAALAGELDHKAKV
jgi:predicted regulator of Ras-like GTPase activity (Roadblock/LC7/MglB family)